MGSITMNRDVIQKTIDHYEVLEIIGQGGMSTVYKALDTQLQRPVALKLMHHHLADKPDFQSRFLAEGRAIAALDHPNIIQVFEVALRDGQLFLIMDYMDDGSLRHRLNSHLEQEKFLDFREIVSLTKQIAQALHYAHGQGIIHRDVKPDNVLLKAESEIGASPIGLRAVLTDFGLAKRMDHEGPMTATGELLGTLAYMAPEQFTGGIIDSRCDIYALGVTLYELVAGQAPFGSASAVDMILMHTQGEPQRVQDLRPDTPPALVSIIHRCMIKNPDERYETAGEIARELEALEKSFKPFTPTLKWPMRPPAPTEGPLTLYDVLPALDRSAIPVDLFSEGTDDVIIVTPFDGQSWSLPFEKPSILVGRDADCDLRLDDQRVSRNHLRIDRLPDGQIIVADLGSMNGSFLGDDKLPGNLMESWSASHSIKVGPYWLTLRLAKTPVGMGRRMALTAPRTIEHPIPGQDAVVRLTPTDSVVEPGSAVNVRIEVENNEEEPQYYMIGVQGVPPEWFTVAPFPLYVRSTRHAERSITFHPPRVPTSAATSYDYVITIHAKDQERQQVQLNGTLHVFPYFAFTSHIELRKNRDIHIAITNEGNSQRYYVVEVREPHNMLLMLPSRTRTLIAPGQDTALAIHVRPKRRPAWGHTRHYPIEVFIRTDGLRPEAQTVNYALWPVFPWEAVLLALLFIMALIIFLVGSR
jgi:serine/threonine protein kinase